MTKSTQYRQPTVPAQWANSRNTHDAVAMAIHAIATSKRSPEAIWEAPTPGEWDNVCMAVENYLDCDLFPRDPEGRYMWGEETVHIPHA